MWQKQNPLSRSPYTQKLFWKSVFSVPLVTAQWWAGKTGKASAAWGRSRVGSRTAVGQGFPPPWLRASMCFSQSFCSFRSRERNRREPWLLAPWAGEEPGLSGDLTLQAHRWLIRNLPPLFTISRSIKSVNKKENHIRNLCPPLQTDCRHCAEIETRETCPIPTPVLEVGSGFHWPPEHREKEEKLLEWNNLIDTRGKALRKACQRGSLQGSGRSFPEDNRLPRRPHIGLRQLPSVWLKGSQS